MVMICAGIVSYNPDLNRLKESIDALCKQVKKVYLVDNGSDNISDVKEIVKNYAIELISNEKNYGIAKALNQLCENAMLDGYSWILTLDQDTVVASNLIRLMQKYCSDENIGILCPTVKYEGWNNRNNYKKHNKDLTEVSACMTSASLTRLDAWKLVAGFREEYFIDFVDNEFCMKLRLHGYKIVRVETCTISHQLGESNEIIIFGIFKIRYTVHSSLRFYYMSRNNWAFIHEYKDHLNFPKEIIKFLYVMSKGVIFAKDRNSTVKNIFKGIKDANSNQFGQYM